MRIPRCRHKAVFALTKHTTSASVGLPIQAERLVARAMTIALGTPFPPGMEIWPSGKEIGCVRAIRAGAGGHQRGEDAAAQSGGDLAWPAWSR